MSKNEAVNVKISKDCTIYKINLDSEHHLCKKAFLQASKKCQNTMSYSQSGQYRTREMKFQMQLMGTIAEIYCDDLILRVLVFSGLSKKWEIIRYDDVRTDNFTTSTGEYDLKLVRSEDNFELVLECRSSMVYDRSLESALSAFDIIGPYSSEQKSVERYRDVYLRPLYVFDYAKFGNYDKAKFHDYLKAGGLSLYFVGGCFKSDMQSLHITKSMGQGSTQYEVVPISHGFDAQSFFKKLIHILKNV